MTPPRGFEVSEYQERLARAQKRMADQELGALLLTQDADIRYFTGFLTRFWESPTRPWFLVVPAQGQPIAVIPSIGQALMQSCWISDIRTWRAPDYDDDGITLLNDSLREVAMGARVGVPTGLETRMGMPLNDWARLQESSLSFVSDDGLVRRLRAVKSEAEIAKIRAACAIADRSFARVPEIAAEGVPLEQVFRHFQMLALQEGADWVAYLAGASGAEGYSDVISPATHAPVAAGDVLMLDTGLVHDGYFCDFDRNFSIGPPSDAVKRAHETLIEAIDSGAAAARVGQRAADVFHAMDEILTGGQDSEAGRLGHGLGMQLTEGLSLIPEDNTRLEPGMVITLEPGIEVRPGRIMVHEEDIVIRDTGVEFLSTRAEPDIQVIRG
ncbi:MAG: M24 family metallopeptidase [Arenibacterium sp.]